MLLSAALIIIFLSTSNDINAPEVELVIIKRFLIVNFTKIIDMLVVNFLLFNSGYCTRKMHVFVIVNFITYSANSCHQCTETTMGLCYH